MQIGSSPANGTITASLSYVPPGPPTAIVSIIKYVFNIYRKSSHIILFVFSMKSQNKISDQIGIFRFSVTSSGIGVNAEEMQNLLGDSSLFCRNELRGGGECHEITFGIYFLFLKFVNDESVSH